MNINEARQALQKLLERYDKYKEDKSFLSNEKQICESLILPLFRNVLKWDTEDPSEFRLEEQRAGKRPDYLVYHQGMTQFIVEAKAATKDLFEDETALKQALEYGYNADKDFVVLTNFKQFIVLAPKIQYRNPIEAAIVRVNLLNISDTDLQTVLGFEKEYWLSSGKNNILYSKLLHHKKSVPVDDRLLDDMKKWREMLLTNIQKHNHKLNFEDEQEFSEIEKEVQKFIDRLVFICCCEDKGIHHEPTLKRMLNDKNGHYAMNPGWLLGETQKLFTKYRKVPDSDLFDLSPADKYNIEDSKLIELFTDLREPKGRPAYNFDEIDEDILGKVYENFIGHVQTGKKRFKEKEDIGKRKKEGIYYTPKYIVEYIVNNTVREYIKGKSFEEILKVKILDPACGSGSFLLRAFNVLVEESAKALKRPLTYGEKKQLLLNCIYGVDLDEKAVEITKLTFSLKLAQITEGLPVLADNIRHGNSLIDDKAVAGEYLAFKWEDEFKEIIQNGGFDIVIGNPPYGATVSKEQKDWFNTNYSDVNKGEIETFALFYGRAIQLLQKKGYLGFITPDSWFTNLQFSKLRRKILEEGKLVRILDAYKTFQDAKDTRCHVIIYKKNLTSKEPVLVEMVNPQTCRQNKLNIIKSFWTEWSTFKEWNERQWQVYQTPEERKLIEKITNNSSRLQEIAWVRYGIRTGDNAKFIKDKPATKTDYKVVAGSDIDRYYFNWKPKYLVSREGISDVYFTEKTHHDKILIQYVRTNSVNLGSRWLEATIVSDDFLGLNSTTMIFEEKADYPLKYILAILNSKLMNRYYKLIYTDVNVKPAYLSELPIRSCSKELKNKIIGLVTQLIELNTKLVEIKIDHTQNIKDKIKLLDNQLDNVIYDVYDLNKTERELVEEIYNYEE